MLALNFLCHARNQLNRIGFAAADSDVAADLAGRRVQLSLGLFVQLQDLLGSFAQQYSGLREHELSASSYKQLLPDFLLKILYLPG